MKTLIRNAAALTCTAMAMLIAPGAQANNIQVTNPTLINGTGGNATIQFDLSWENSWQGMGAPNHDAAWVIVKYRTSSGIWRHARLNNTGHVVSWMAVVEPGRLDPQAPFDANTNPVVGVFIHRDGNGSGTLTLSSVQLSWNCGEQGLFFTDITEMQVFAIEMVYVRQGEFAAGSGGSESSAFTLTTISSDNTQSTPTGTGSLGGQQGGRPTGQAAATNAFWPNGYDQFYCMKYEVSQQGYVDFLNTLTYDQQIARTATAPNSPIGTGALTPTHDYRNGINIRTSGVNGTTPAVYGCDGNNNGTFGEATDGQDLPCSFLSWGDLSAYLDWSALRPMTEMEFEKACRGGMQPVPNEYPWGSTTIATSQYTLSNSRAANEGIASNFSTSSGNAAYYSTMVNVGSPGRVGLFAANVGNTGRVTSGAGYYGAMELAGNLVERCITIGSVEGRAFTRTYGNGVLTTNGDHDVATWPDAGSAEGTGFRGGSVGQEAAFLRVSDRNDAQVVLSNRSPNFGGRGVREFW